MTWAAITWCGRATLAQTAGAFLACGAHDEVLRVVRYLRAIQEDDGSWPQNCWLDGSPYWHGMQLDECAFPILLLDMAWRDGAVQRPVLPAFWPMVARAAGFVICHGPRTGQDRWEENSGYTPFTLAVEVAALLAAADLAEACDIDGVADFLRDTADAWNEQIEDWVYVTDTRLAREVGVAGYYVRIAPEVPGEARAELRGTVEVRNRFAEASHVAADELISTDALALVRFGLRAADDPRIVDTVKVIDHVLRVDLPYGPGWRRYNGDGYGEHDDGSPYDGTGIGRVWPLLAGERAHYELAAGRRAAAERLLAAMEAGASPGRLLPEQVWDGPPIPALELERGQAQRFGDAAGVGACRAHQAAALAGGRRGVRPAAAAGPALSAGEARGALPAVAAGLASTVRAAGRVLRLDLPAAGAGALERRWLGDRRTTCRHATPGWASTRPRSATDGLGPGGVDRVHLDGPCEQRPGSARNHSHGDGAGGDSGAAAVSPAGIACASRPPTRTGSIRRASPVASSVSTNTPHTVASPSAGASRSPGILRQNRSVAASFAMPITLS